MSMEVNLNVGVPQMPVQPSAEEIAAKTVEQMASILGAAGGSVQVSQAKGVSGEQPRVGATSAPVVDEADEALAAKADLEALVAYLQMAMDEQQAEVQAKRIDSLKGQLKSAHDSQMDKINESIEKAREQEKAAKAQRALSWLGAIFAVFVAVVVTVCTGGAAAAFAIAGAALAVGSLIMSETGADKKLLKAMSASIRDDFGCSKQTADAWAQGIYGAVQLVLGLTCAIGGGAAAAGGAQGMVKLGTTAANVLKYAQSIGGGLMGVTGMATTAASTALGYQAGVSQAEATEAQAVLDKLMKFLEESEEELQAILEQLMNAGGALMELLESKTDTLNRITQEIGSQNA